MSKFTIEIDTAGAAFEDDEREVHRILNRLIYEAPISIQRQGCTGILIDANGNHCGKWAVSEDAPAAPIIPAPPRPGMF
jgi:hypothetical protein